MATEANRAATVTPRSGAEGLPPWQGLSHPQPGQTDQPQKVPPQEKPRRRSRRLKELGACHVVVALLYVFLGGYLAAMETFQKNYLAACLTANAISFFCVLCGLFVIAKDLFLESPFDFPVWKPYPNDTVHIQRLVLALLCVTCLEVFLPGLMAILAYRDTRLAAEKDDLSLGPDMLLELRGSPMTPPPSYDDVTKGNGWQEQKQM